MTCVASYAYGARIDFSTQIPQKGPGRLEPHQFRGVAKEIIRERAGWMIFHDPSQQGLMHREQLERIGIPVAHGRLNTADWKNRPPEIQRFALIQEELRRRTAMRRR